MYKRQHPDFSYRGRKGIIALTGYNGILGYRTSDRVYGPGGTGDWENANLEADKAKAKAVADAMRANGWEFASHSWGHINYGSAKMCIRDRLLSVFAALAARQRPATLATTSLSEMWPASMK